MLYSPAVMSGANSGRQTAVNERSEERVDGESQLLSLGRNSAWGRLCCNCFCCLLQICFRCGICRSANAAEGAAAAKAATTAASAAAAAASATMRGAAPRHHQPASLSTLSRQTRFSRQELQLMYRGFKNECPSGLVNRAAFREIFTQFFPLGDASAYADLVFDSFDPDGWGCLTFETVIQGLSVICKGGSMEKLDWAFRLYDTDRDGFISKAEMVRLVSAIYAMLGDSVRPRVNPCDAQLHAERIFEAMDTDRDGAVSFQEFVIACRRGRDLDRELGCFDTLL